LAIEKGPHRSEPGHALTISLNRTERARSLRDCRKRFEFS
jgi:hypothetical protein